MIEGQASYDVTIDFEVLDSLAQFEEIEKEAKKLAGSSAAAGAVDLPVDLARPRPRRLMTAPPRRP